MHLEKQKTITNQMLRQTIPKALLITYVAFVMVLSVVPFSNQVISLNNTHVLSLRLDYLLHALVFIPMVPLLRFSRPDIPLWIAFVLSLGLAIVAEGIHYYLPYRAYNINDLLGNIIGVVLGLAIVFLVNSLAPGKLFVSNTEGR